jgi:hypothetical protein
MLGFGRKKLSESEEHQIAEKVTDAVAEVIEVQINEYRVGTPLATEEGEQQIRQNGRDVAREVFESEVIEARNKKGWW